MNQNKQQCVVAVGTFDGVHAGHRHLLASLRAYAVANRLRAVVVTFTHHPMLTIKPDHKLRLLSSDERRVSMLRREVDSVEVLDFDRAMLLSSAETFLRMLRDKYAMVAFFAGHDTVVGHDRLSGEALAEVCGRLGVRFVDVTECFLSPTDGARVSSSHIRKLISSGDVEQASALLGYDYELSGKVVHGNHIGTRLGFPTANLVPECNMIVPGRGVYAVKVLTPDRVSRPAVVNIGVRPTVAEGSDCSIEAHLLDYSGNLYDACLTVSFVARLRDERKFDSVDALREQLVKDVELSKQVLQQHT